MARSRPTRAGKEVCYSEWLNALPSSAPSLQRSEWLNALPSSAHAASANVLTAETHELVDQDNGRAVGSRVDHGIAGPDHGSGDGNHREEEAALRTLAGLHRVMLPSTPLTVLARQTAPSVMRKSTTKHAPHESRGGPDAQCTASHITILGRSRRKRQQVLRPGSPCLSPLLIFMTGSPCLLPLLLSSY